MTTGNLKKVVSKKGKTNIMSWSWVIITAFFVLSIVNVYFGLFGLVCMGAPILHALRGEGKAHCARFCPRGSFLKKFLNPISMGNKLPKFMNTKAFKNGMLALMIGMFTFSMIHTGGDISHIAFALFRFMFASFVIGVIMGVIFKGRSWCTVCPMGHAAGLVGKLRKKPQPVKVKVKNYRQNG